MRFRTAIHVLFPVLTSLLQPATPEWFRSHISTHLSLLPLRPGGIKQTINFIAGSAPQEFPDPNARSTNRVDQSQRPSLSLEVISQVSRLLSAVPSSMTAEEYFAALAPELLQLLDDQSPDSQRAGAYIIGNGILGRRKYGSPGTVGWKIFAEPIIRSFNPVTAKKGTASKSMANVDKNGLCPIVVAEEDVRLSLQRLASLVLLHPNPGLTKRLINPSLSSLWGLLCYAKESKRSGWVDRIHQILCTYIKTSVGVDKLMVLSDELLWDGESSWTYGPGPTGGVQIQQRLEDSFHRPDIITMVQNIDNRVDEFFRLLKSGAAEDDEIGSLFMHVSKHWLVDDEDASRQNRLEPGEDTGKDPLNMLVYAKLTQRMLEEYKDKLAAAPKRLIELVIQLLSAYSAEHETIEARRTRASIPSLAALGTIVDPHVAIEGDVIAAERPHDEDSTEMISVALSLLTAIFSSPEFAIDLETFTVLDSLRKSLAHLATPGKSFPASIGMTATNILALLNLHRSLPPTPLEKTKKPSDPHSEDRKTHQQALTYLTDPTPPIRAQGISLLTSLISKPSPILDVLSTTVLLQSLLADDDEFVHLSAIKALGLLASRHPNAVATRLVEQYVDVAEDVGLDVRIRTGEALLQTVERLGAALPGDVAATVADGMIAVAGRRGRKPKARESRRTHRQRAEQSQRDADEAWGGEAPDLSGLDPHPAPAPAAAAEDATLLAAWTGADGDSDADDTRMRASALSILGAAIETNLRGLGPALALRALDLVTGTLRHERGPATAIVRRAAVMLARSFVSAGAGADGLEELRDVLREVEGREGDMVVRGHVRAVLEELDGSDRRGGMVVPVGRRGVGGIEVVE